MQPIEAGYTASGDWVGIFGNGPYSASEKAVLFVVNLETGAVIASITAGKDIDEANGLMGVTLIRDGNQVITGAYAGDLQGNLWRFNLSSSNTDLWSDARNITRVFTTDGNRAITHPPAFTAHPLGGRMVLFGTGKFYDVADSMDTSTEYLYGIRDQGDSVSVTSLLRRVATAVTMPFDGRGYAADDQVINWETHNGWSLAQTMGNGQRNLYKPSFVGSNVVFSTTLTGAAVGSGMESGAVVETCEIQGLTGLKVMVNAYSGGNPSIKSDSNRDGVIDDSDDFYISFPTDGSGPGDMLINPGLSSGSSDFTMASCSSGVLLTLDGVPFCTGEHDSTAWSQLF